MKINVKAGWSQSVPSWSGIAVFAAILVVVILIGPSARDTSLVTSGLVLGIGATGLGLMWGQAGQVTVAHGAIIGVGAYAAGILANKAGWTFLQTLPVTVLAAATMAAAVSLLALRTTGHYFVILTFAVGEVLVLLASRLDSLTGGLNGMLVLPGQDDMLRGTLVDRGSYLQLVSVFSVLAVALCYGISRSPWGVRLRAVRENEDLARSLGLNVGLQRTLVFAVGGALAGVSGQLYLYQSKFIAPSTFGTDLSIFLVLMVLLGGRQYLLGPAIGALVYVLLPSAISLTPTRSQMALGLCLIVIILVLPGGLLSLGGRIKKRLDGRSSARRIEDHGPAVDSASESTAPASRAGHSETQPDPTRTGMS